MALSNRQKDTPVPPELQPYYEGNKHSGRLRWLLGLIGLVVIIALLIGGIIWLAHRHANSKTTSTKPIGSSHSQTNKSTTPQSSPSSTSSGTGSNSATSGTPATSTGSDSSTSFSPESAPATIPNTGPGDTLGIFAGASTLGMIGYQIRVRQKLATKESTSF